MTPKGRHPPPRRVGLPVEVLAEAIALTLVAALPAFMNLVSAGVFEEEKSLLVRAAALVALPGAWLGSRVLGVRFRRHPIVVSLAAFTAMIVLSSLAAAAPREAFLGAHLRRHGAVTMLALAVLFVALCIGARSRAGRHRLLGAVVIGSIWPSLYLLLQRGGFDPVEWVTATAGPVPGSTFGNPVMMGGYLAAVVSLTAAHAWRSRSVGAGVALALQLAALAASESRGALVALAAGTLVFALTVAWVRWPKHAVLASVGVLAVAAALALVPVLRPAAISRQLDPNVGTARVRVLIWKGAVAHMRASGARLLVGYGPESLHGLFPEHYSPELGRIEGTDAMPDRAHNETIDTLVSAGVLGVVLQIAFFAATLIAACRVADYRLRAGLAAAAVAHIIEIQFGIATVTSRLVLLCVAALAVTADTPEPATAGTPTTPPALLIVAPLVGVLSPVLSRLPSVVGSPGTTGTAAELLASLARWSMATPLLYGTLLGAALLLARSLAAQTRTGTSRWWHAGGLAASVAAAVPLSITPSRADIVSQAAADLESRQQWTEAAMAYREASRLQPGESDYLAGMGRALIQEAVSLDPVVRVERLKVAGAALENASRLRPSDLDHTRHLASLLRVQAWSAGADERARAGPLARADRLYAGATDRAPGLASLWIEWAHVDIDQHQLTEALEKLTHVLTLDDSRVEAWLLRGHVHRTQQAFREALADYENALARAPRHLDALRGRAIALAELQRHQEALAVANDALTMAPTDPELQRLRAQLESMYSRPK